MTGGRLNMTAGHAGDKAPGRERPRGFGLATSAMALALAGSMVALPACGAGKVATPIAAPQDAAGLEAFGPASWRFVHATPGRAQQDLARTMRRLHLGVLELRWRPAATEPDRFDGTPGAPGAPGEPAGEASEPRRDHVEGRVLLTDGRTAWIFLTSLTPGVSLAPDRRETQAPTAEANEAASLAPIAIGVRVGRLGDPRAELRLAEAVARTLTGPAAPVRYSGFELPVHPQAAQPNAAGPADVSR